jgi:DNA repair exonuclease SbcCD ATPase subunit
MDDLSFENIVNADQVQQTLDGVKSSLKEISNDTITFNSGLDKALSATIALYDDYINNVRKLIEELKTLSDTYSASLAKTATTINTNNKITENAENDVEAAEKEKREKLRFEKDLQFQLEQAEINNMNNSVERVIKQNQLNYKKEVEAFKRTQEDKLTEINNLRKKQKLEPLATLDKESLKYYDNLIVQAQKNADIKLEKETDAFLENQINSYGSYYDKLLFINDKYDKLLASNDKKFHDQINRNRQTAIGQLNIDQNALIENLNGYKNLFQNILTLSKRTAKIVVDSLKSQIQKLYETGKISAEQYKKAIEKLDDTLEKKREKKNDITSYFVLGSNGGIESVLNVIKQGAKNQYEQGMEMWLQGMKENDSPTMLEGLNMKDSGLNMMEGIDSAMSAMAIIGAIIKFVYSVIKGVSELTKGFKEMQEAFDNDAGAESTAKFQEYFSILEGHNTRIMSAWEKLKSGDAIGSTVDSLMLIIETVKKWAEIQDNKLQKSIEKLEKDVEKLKEKYADLDRVISKAYSAKAGNLIQEQLELLETQKEIIEYQKQLEQDKKNTDDDKIKEYNNTIKQLEYNIEDLQDKRIEAINGTSIQSAIADFANAYASAWNTGEDKAKAIKDVVRKMIQTAVTELIKGRMSPAVTNFSKALSEAMADGILSADEELNLDALSNEIYNSVGDLSNFDKYLDTDAAVEASKKGFASMSQDTANELNGRFTAIQTHTYSINEQMKLLYSNSNNILNTVVLISTHTMRLHAIENSVGAMNNGINDMVTRGVLLRR